MKRYLALAILLFSAMLAAALASQTSNRKQNGSTSTPSLPVNRGEQIFQANCGRCHTPPMSISQRTTGTVIMHMRTRARLSREDEQLLLKYLAP